MADFYDWQGDDLVLRVRLQPKASSNAIVGVQGDALKIRLTAPPVDGKANKALCKFLGKAFGVAPSQVDLETGTTGRTKRLRIHAPKCLPVGISAPKP